jgi:hypothetical protein
MMTKEQKSEYMRKYRLKNKERLKQYIREYKQKNRERVLAVQRILNHKKYVPRRRVRKPKPEPTRPPPPPKLVITKSVFIQF